MRALFLTGTFVLSLPMAAFAATDHFAPWKTFLDESLRQSVSWPRLQNDLEAARIANENARATFLPKVQADLSAGPVRSSLAGTLGSVNSDWTSAASLSASISLFENTEDLERWRIADLEYERAKLNIRLEKQRLIFDLIDKTLDLCFSFEQERLSEESLRETSRQADMAEKLFRQGMRRRQDYLQLRSQAERAELDRRAARSTTLRAREALRVLNPLQVGDFQPAFCPKERAPLISELATPAKIENQILDLEDKLVTARARREWRHWLPEARVGAEVRHGSSDFYPNGSFSTNEATTSSVLLTLRWVLFDGGVRRNVDEMINLNTRSSRLEAERRMRQVRRDIAEFNDQVDSFKLEAARTESLYQADKITYDIAAQDFRAGRLGYFEFLNALRQMFSSEQRAREVRIRSHRLFFRHLLLQGDLDEKFSL